jgi:hypothetical protein
MKSRPLLNRVRKAAITPTAAERLALKQGKAAEKAARQADEVVDGKFPDPSVDLRGFHAALERSHARYLAQFPPGYRPLDAALKAFAAAAPRSPALPYRIREGVTLSQALAAFKRKCDEGVYDPDVYERVDGADDETTT